MEVSGQLHMPDALPKSKKTLVLTKLRSDRPRVGLEAVEMRKIIWSCRESNPDSSVVQATSYPLRRLSYLDSVHCYTLLKTCESKELNNCNDSQMECLLCDVYFELLIKRKIYIDQRRANPHTAGRGQYFHCAMRRGMQKFNSGNYRYFGNWRAEDWNLFAGNRWGWNTILCFIRILSFQKCRPM
jgi:hypothetical protein